MDTTTIQVEKPTKELLNNLKRSLDSKTYDEVIQKLAKKKTKSIYGKLVGEKKISAKEMLKDLRDKHDRV